MFAVVTTETYLKEISRWGSADREAVEKLPLKLKENPFAGKPLCYPFLREKGVCEKRVYYPIYEDLKLMLFVATSGKKNQQEVIDYIREHLQEYRFAAEQWFKQPF